MPFNFNPNIWQIKICFEYGMVSDLIKYSNTPTDFKANVFLMFFFFHKHWDWYVEL